MKRLAAVFGLVFLASWITLETLLALGVLQDPATTVMSAPALLIAIAVTFIVHREDALPAQDA